jgi:hypothetical protein
MLFVTFENFKKVFGTEFAKVWDRDSISYKITDLLEENKLTKAKTSLIF